MVLKELVKEGWADEETRRWLWSGASWFLAILLAMAGACAGCLMDIAHLIFVEQIAGFSMILVSLVIVFLVRHPRSSRWQVNALLWTLTFIGGVTFGRMAAGK